MKCRRAISNAKKAVNAGLIFATKTNRSQRRQNLSVSPILVATAGVLLLYFGLKMCIDSKRNCSVTQTQICTFQQLALIFDTESRYASKRSTKAPRRKPFQSTERGACHF
jgi:hypothetical protein